MGRKLKRKRKKNREKTLYKQTLYIRNNGYILEKKRERQTDREKIWNWNRMDKNNYNEKKTQKKSQV